MGRAAVNQKVLITAEYDNGSMNQPHYSLPGMSIEFSPKLNTKMYRVAGQKYPTSGVLNREWVEGRFTGPLDFNEFIFALASVFGIQMNSKQTVTITGTPTGGTFTLTFGGQTTSAIAYNAAASAVQSALAALSTIGTGNVRCTGGALPGTAVVVEFIGTLAGAAQSAITGDGASLTGGTTPAVSIAQTVTGGAATPQSLGSGAYLWQVNPNASGADPFYSFTVERGDTEAAQRSTFGVFNSLELTANEDSSQVSGDFMARAIDNSIDAIAELTSEVQEISCSGTPTGGTFTLTYSAQTATAIPYNATAAQILAKLQGLSNIGDDDVIVTGGPFPDTPVQVLFTGALAATNVAAITANSSGLTGGSSPTVSIATLLAGGAAVSQVSQQPAACDQFDLYLDSTFANVGTTKWISPFEIRVAIPKVRVPNFVLNTDYPSFKDLVEIAIENIQFEVTAEFDSQTRGFYDTLKTSSLPIYYAKLLITGASIGGGNSYGVSIICPVKVENCEALEAGTENSIYAYKFTFRIMKESSMLRPLAIDVTNTLSSLY